MILVNIFGAFSEKNNKIYKEIADLFPVQKNLKLRVGGYFGALKIFYDIYQKKGGRIELVITKEGVLKGFYKENILNTKKVTGYFNKKKILLDDKACYFIFLPPERMSLGLFTEVVETIDQLQSFNFLIDKNKYRIYFIGNSWDIILKKINPFIKKETRKYLSFVKEREIKNFLEKLLD